MPSRLPFAVRAIATAAFAAVLAASPLVEMARAQPPLDKMPVVATWTWTGGESSRSTALAVSPNGQLVLSGHYQVAILWDPAKNRAANVLRGHKDTVVGAAFFADNRRAVTADKKSIIVWDVEAGRQLSTWVADQTALNAMAASPDGRYLATGGEDNMVRMWELATGKLRWTKGEKKKWSSIGSLAFSPDGQVVASGGQAVVLLRAVATGKEVGRLHASAYAWAVAFARDGRAVAAAESGLVRVWNMDSKKQEIARIDAPKGAESPYFQGTAFLAKGRHVAVADCSGSVLVGALATAEFIATSPEPPVKGCRVAVSPDGNRAYVGRQDGSIMVLDLTSLQ